MKYAKRVLQEGGNDPMDLSISRIPGRRAKSTRQLNLVRIILKLASINGYNEREEILMDDGTYLSNTNVIELLNYALTPTKLRKGIEQFVDLLHKAGVEPSMISNNQVKQLLTQRIKRVPLQSPPPTSYEEPVISRSEGTTMPINLKRRQSFDDDDDNRKRFKRSGNLPAEAMKPEPQIDWDYDDSDL